MKKILTILLCALMLMGCSSDESNSNNMAHEEWTYDKLEEEFGGIIETNFSSTKKCLGIIENADFKVCGTIIEKKENSVFGIDLYYLRVTDDKNNSYSDNTIDVCVTEYAFSKVSEGDFIYAAGTANYVDYGGAESENSVQMNCSGEGESIYTYAIDESISVSEYVNIIREISEDTYFQTEGLIIQDGDSYKLYESKEAYKENKYGYIGLEFTEEQNNLNGNIVTVMGKPDTYLHNGLVGCSIIEE